MIPDEKQIPADGVPKPAPESKESDKVIDIVMDTDTPTTSQEATGSEQTNIATPPSGDPNPMHVKLPVYDGPLDLLLDLIRENKMDIYDIQISVITKQYLEYLACMRKLDLEIAGEFIVIAATLIYIKSKMLLPADDEQDEDEGGDPRAELVQKLLEYQAFKEAARSLGMLEGERAKVFTRQIADIYLADLDPEDAGIDSFSANLYDLLSAFQKVLAKISRDKMHEVYEEVISIEEKMTEIQALLIENKFVLFSQLFQEPWTRNQLIATFLAILELVRTRFARVMQEKQFGDIRIEKVEQIES